MKRVRVHRLLEKVLYLDDDDLEEDESPEEAATAIARDLPEGDWTVVDEWVE